MPLYCLYQFFCLYLMCMSPLLFLPLIPTLPTPTSFATLPPTHTLPTHTPHSTPHTHTPNIFLPSPSFPFPSPLYHFPFPLLQDRMTGDRDERGEDRADRTGQDGTEEGTGQGQEEDRNTWHWFWHWFQFSFRPTHYTGLPGYGFFPSLAFYLRQTVHPPPKTYLSYLYHHHTTFALYQKNLGLQVYCGSVCGHLVCMVCIHGFEYYCVVLLHGWYAL